MEHVVTQDVMEFSDEEEENFVPPLHDAVKRGDLRYLEILLNGDADVNMIDENGCTALHFAVA